MRTLDDFFLTEIPRRLTRSGRIGSASDSRFCTSTCEMFKSVPGSKVTVNVYLPSLVHCDDMYIMRSTPLTCCSMGAATVSATTWALAPGYTVVTRMIGGAISGYCATGSVGNDTAPAMMTRIAMTHATMGRRMK